MIRIDIKKPCVSEYTIKREPEPWRSINGAPIYYKVIVYMNENNKWAYKLEKYNLEFDRPTRYVILSEFDSIDEIDTMVRTLPDMDSHYDIDRYLLTYHN